MLPQHVAKPFGSIHYLPSAPDPAHVQALLDAAREISTLMGSSH